MIMLYDPQQANPVSDAFCSDVSYAAGEKLVGTAPTVEVWFLLEYTSAWTAKATSDNDLPQPVQQWFNRQLETVKNSRLQFIKQDSPARQPAFFVVLAREVRPVIYQFQLAAYDRLLTLDVPALLAGEPAYDPFLWSQRLYLVCTNGKRDPCCALYGLALYRALSAHAGATAWQTTHLGGHRFAPTLLTFPIGAYYGRLAPEEVVSFIAAQQQGEIYLENYRGRVCYDEVEQAADYFLRRRTGSHAVADFHHLDTHQVTADTWHIRFTAPATADVHHVRLMTESVMLPIYASCGKPQTKPIVQFHLLEHEVSRAGEMEES